jgi:hypothetical protein
MVGQGELWLEQYNRASGQYATCRYLETVGSGAAAEWAAPLIALHDARTRADAGLPLA